MYDVGTCDIRVREAYCSDMILNVKSCLTR